MVTDFISHFVVCKYCGKHTCASPSAEVHHKSYGPVNGAVHYCSGSLRVFGFGGLKHSCLRRPRSSLL